MPVSVIIFNERVQQAHERKEWMEECRRIDRMELEADISIAQKRKRLAVKLLAVANN